jgi:hypothetical protein
MKFIHILLILIVILYLMQDGSVLSTLKPSKFCQTYETMDGPIEVCRENYNVNKWEEEGFDIPLNPKELCESRCATNLDHAELLMNKQILLEDCVKKCHNL